MRRWRTWCRNTRRFCRILDEFFGKGIPNDDIDLKGFREAIFLQFSTALFIPAEQLAQLRRGELTIDEEKKQQY